MAPRKKTEGEKRKNIVCVKLTDIELSILDQHAAGARLSRSEYIRGLILNKKMTVKYQIVINSEDIRSLLMQYGKIGSNLNQIAKYFNTGGERSLAMEEEIQRCLASLFSLKKEVFKLAGDLNSNRKTHQK